MIKRTPAYDTKGRRKPKQVMGFKSKLEYITSKWLTQLGIKAEYEPFTYKTKIGNYTPDFYCPEISTFIECKPSIEFAATDLYKEFGESHPDCEAFIIITPYGIYGWEKWHENKDVGIEKDEFGALHYPKEMLVKLCYDCKKISFCTNEGYWSCRHCNSHDGDSGVRPSNDECERYGIMYIPFNEFYINRYKKRGWRGYNK